MLTIPNDWEEICRRVKELERRMGKLALDKSSLTCRFCHQPIGEKSVFKSDSLGVYHANQRECVQEAARRCAEIAFDAQYHNRNALVEIRKEFGVKGRFE